MLPSHIAFLTTLRPGIVTVRTTEGVTKFTVGAGFAEVGATRVTLLTESCEGV